VDIHLTQVAPTCSMAAHGGISTEFCASLTSSFRRSRRAVTTCSGCANGNIFVSDILCGATQTGCTGGLTGPVDVTAPAVPDGGMTVMLLGGVLVGLETLRRRLRA
jgi:hypothetical protein